MWDPPTGSLRWSIRKWPGQGSSKSVCTTTDVGAHVVHGLSFMTSVIVTCCNSHKYNLDRRQLVVGVDSGVSWLLPQAGLTADEQCGNATGLPGQYTFFSLLTNRSEV